MCMSMSDLIASVTRFSFGCTEHMMPATTPFCGMTRPRRFDRTAYATAEAAMRSLMVQRAFIKGSHVGVQFLDYRLQHAPTQMVETWARSAVSIAVPVVLLGDQGIPAQAAYFDAGDPSNEALEQQVQESTILMRRSRPMEAGRTRSKTF